MRTLRQLLIWATLFLTATISICHSVEADEEQSRLIMEGAVTALIDMGNDVAYWSRPEVPILCVGVRLSRGTDNEVPVNDLPKEEFERLSAVFGNRAVLHDASTCPIDPMWGPVISGRRAWLLTYIDVDTWVDLNLVGRRLAIPVRARRTGYEPNREVPPHGLPWFELQTRPDHRLKWDGFGEMSYARPACGYRNFDFVGSEVVTIRSKSDDPQICD